MKKGEVWDCKDHRIPGDINLDGAVKNYLTEGKIHPVAGVLVEDFSLIFQFLSIKIPATEIKGAQEN